MEHRGLGELLNLCASGVIVKSAEKWNITAADSGIDMSRGRFPTLALHATSMRRTGGLKWRVSAQ
jgi:hypothetical protein